MQFKILGTAAYERVPAMFCQCAVCEQARLLGGKNMRSQAQVLINDDLLVDFGQDNYLHYLSSGADYTKIKNLLVTHTHEDHFMPDELRMTTGGMAKNDMTEPIGVWGTQACADMYATNAGNKLCEMHVVAHYDTFRAGRYTVTVLPANHSDVNAILFIISDGEKTLLYNNDTGYWPEEAYDFVAQKKIKFDCVISDCTFGFQDRPGRSHMSIDNNKVHRQRLLDMGAVTEDTPWIVTHFSHNGLLNNGKPVSAEELEQYVAAFGMLAAHDGLVVRL